MWQNWQRDKKEFQATDDFEKIENLKNPLNRRVEEQLENLKTDVTQKSFYEIKTDDKEKEYVEYKTTTIINYLNQIKDKVKNLSGIKNLTNSAAYIMCIQIWLEACWYEVWQIDWVLSNKEWTEKSQTEKAIIQLKKHLRKTDPNIRINGIPDSSIIPYLIDWLVQHDDWPKQQDDWPKQQDDWPKQQDDWPEQQDDWPKQQDDWPEQQDDWPKQQDDWPELDGFKVQIIKQPEDVTSADIWDIPDINENRVEISQNQPIEVKKTLIFHKEIQNGPDLDKINPKSLWNRENWVFIFNKTTSEEIHNWETRNYVEINDKFKCEYKYNIWNEYIDFLYYDRWNHELTSYNGIRYFKNWDIYKKWIFDETETGESIIKAWFKKGFYTKIIDNNIKLTCYNDDSITLTIPQWEIQNFMDDLGKCIQRSGTHYTLDWSTIKINNLKNNVNFKNYDLTDEELVNILKFLKIDM